MPLLRDLGWDKHVKGECLTDAMVCILWTVCDQEIFLGTFLFFLLQRRTEPVPATDCVMHGARSPSVSEQVHLELHLLLGWCEAPGMFSLKTSLKEAP